MTMMITSVTSRSSAAGNLNRVDVTWRDPEPSPGQPVSQVTAFMFRTAPEAEAFAAPFLALIDREAAERAQARRAASETPVDGPLPDDAIMAALDPDPARSRATWHIAELVKADVDRVRRRLNDMLARGLVQRDEEATVDEHSVYWRPAMVKP